MLRAAKEMTSLIRIDKARVSYECSEAAYTSVSTVLRSSYNAAEDKMNIEKKQAQEQIKKEEEEKLQEKIKDAEKKAEALLFDAEEKARRIMQQAEAEAAECINQAREKGYNDGVQTAQQEMQEQLGKQADTLQRLITQIAAYRETMVDEIEDDFISLVLDTAKKIINIELEKNDKLFVDIVQNALGQMKKDGKIVVRVGQADYASLFSSGSTEFILNDERIYATVIEEPHFEKGDCVIETDAETVNAGVNSQLKYIELAFRNEESHIA